MLPAPALLDQHDRPRVLDAEFLAGATTLAALPPPAIAEVAFAGRSNVGKSSLLNAMMGRKGLARTSNTPGCTRQINVFGVRLEGGVTVHLVDLPGYGYAKVSKTEKSGWGPMLEGYLLGRSTLRALVLLVDVRRGFEEDDRQLLAFAQSSRGVERNKPPTVLVVGTKLDKVALSKRKPAMGALVAQAGVNVIGFSAVTGEGRALLWTRILDAL